MVMGVGTVYGRPLSGSEDPFAARRRTGIGGSDAAAILGVGRSSALGLYLVKRGEMTEDPTPNNRMRWGSRLEGAILAGYSEDTGRPILRGGRRFRRHPTYPFVIGHPDAYADDRIIEAKATARLDERWGEDGSDEVPAHYYAQVQHYEILTGFDLCDLIVLVGGNDPHIYTIEANREFQDALLDQEAQFWRDVQDGNAPEPDGSEDAAKALRAIFPFAVDQEIPATPEISAIAMGYLEARSRKVEAEGEMDRAAQAIQAYMGARERMVGLGFRATWGNRKGSVSWKDTAALLGGRLELDEGEIQAIAEQTRGKGTRTFTLERRAVRE